MTESPRLAAGTRVEDYLLERWVAVGATSEIYAGRHATQDVAVAVKVLLPQWCLHAGMVVRFLEEARTLQRLRHPQLVSARAAGVLAEGRPFMVLEWQQEDLERALKRVGSRLPARDALQVVRQLAEVLALLHEHHLVHRDLKPANVLVVRSRPGDWRIQLADLGLAKRLQPETGPDSLPLPPTASNALLGTCAYMAPEQGLNPRRVDDRADVYSLGILWFQLLAGRLPFTGDQNSLRYLHVVKAPPLDLLEALASPESRVLLAHMLEKQAVGRPSMKEVLNALASCGG